MQQFASSDFYDRKRGKTSGEGSLKIVFPALVERGGEFSNLKMEELGLIEDFTYEIHR